MLHCQQPGGAAGYQDALFSTAAADDRPTSVPAGCKHGRADITAPEHEWDKQNPLCYIDFAGALDANRPIIPVHSGQIRRLISE